MVTACAKDVGLRRPNRGCCSRFISNRCRRRSPRWNTVGRAQRSPRRGCPTARATIIETRKQHSSPNWGGGRGYQPMLMVWGRGEFAAGRLASGPLRPRLARRSKMPPLRDSAPHESELLNWLRTSRWELRPRGLSSGTGKSWHRSPCTCCFAARTTDRGHPQTTSEKSCLAYTQKSST
jgi:hypothetical protein